MGFNSAFKGLSFFLDNLSKGNFVPNFMEIRQNLVAAARYRRTDDAQRTHGKASPPPPLHQKEIPINISRLGVKCVRIQERNYQVSNPLYR